MLIVLFGVMLYLTLMLPISVGLRYHGKQRSRGRRSRAARGRCYKWWDSISFSEDTPYYGSLTFVAPGYGVVNKVSYDFYADQVNILAAHGVDQACFGLYYSKRLFVDVVASQPIGWNGFSSTNHINMNGVHFQPIPVVESVSDQTCSGSSETVIRMEPGQPLHIRCSGHQLLELETHVFRCKVTLWFYVDGMGEYQETLPFQIIFSGEGIRWSPPSEGMFYNIHVLHMLGGDNRYEFVFGGTQYSDEPATFVEVTPDTDTRSWSYDEDRAQFTDFHVHSYYANDESGFEIAVDVLGGDDVGVFVVYGYYAPNPGSEVSLYITHTADVNAEEMFPIYMKVDHIDVSVAWSGASAGDVVIRVSAYPFDSSPTAGSSFLYESDTYLYEYVVGDSSGQHRGTAVVDKTLTPYDVLEIDTASSKTSRFTVILVGSIPEHNYKMRNCSAWLSGENIDPISELE